MDDLPPDDVDTEGAERRASVDRRERPGPGRRGPPTPPWRKWMRFGGREIVIGVAALLAIMFAIRLVHPIFTNQPSVAQKLTQVAPATRSVLAPTPADSTELARLLATPQFARDSAAFAKDLVSTGRISQARADTIAYYAVREAYREGVPPAVVFGVMLTENATFASGALSNVGAIGLMQVYPKIWLKALSAKFGKDLATDSTNLKYGIYILKQYIHSDSGAVTSRGVTTGLLHYNGCVHGSNTANCQNYPTKVQHYVENQGNSLCGNKTFYECIARPFISGLFGKAPGPTMETAATP